MSHRPGLFNDRAPVRNRIIGPSGIGDAC